MTKYGLDFLSESIEELPKQLEGSDFLSRTPNSFHSHEIIKNYKNPYAMDYRMNYCYNLDCSSLVLR